MTTSDLERYARLASVALRLYASVMLLILCCTLAKADPIHYYVGVSETLVTSDNTGPVADPIPVGNWVYGTRHDEHDLLLTPEPSSLLYFATGVGVLALFMRKNRTASW